MLNLPPLCVKVNGSPLPGLTCLCEYGLGGLRCDQMTSQAQSKLFVYLVAGGLAINCTLFCFAELWQRGKPAKVTPIIISLYFGVAACILNTMWCAVGTLNVFDPNHPSVPFLREVLNLVLVPTSTTCPLASVLVISLAWQKVLIQSQMKKKKKKGLAGAMPDASRIQHNLVVGAVSFLFFGGGILIALGLRTVLSSIASLLYGISGFFLISKGKQFATVMGTSTAVSAASPASSAKPSFRGSKVAPSDSSTDGTGALSSMKYALTSLCKPKVSSRTLSKLERVCLAAQAATREASFGMLLVFFCTLVYAMVGSKVGYALGDVEYLSVILGGMQVGNLLTALAAVKYAKKARLIGGNKKKKEVASSEFASSSMASSGDGGGRRTSSVKK
jgi:hypothetical protein